MVGLVVTLWRHLMRLALLRSEHGAELIEMAIVTPLLLLLVFGIVDFGFLFQRYVVLTNAAVEGARVASLPGYTAARRDRPGSRRTSPTRCPAGVVANAAAVGTYGAWTGRHPVARGAGHRHSRLHAAIRRADHEAGGWPDRAATVTLTARSTMRRQVGHLVTEMS